MCSGHAAFCHIALTACFILPSSLLADGTVCTAVFLSIYLFVNRISKEIMGGNS